MAKRKRDPVQGNIPLATQAALQDKTLRPPVKKMDPPLKPYADAYKEAVGPMQEESAWYNPVQQLPADETDVALMMLPIPFLSKLAKPMRGFAEKLLQSNTVKSGTDIVLSHMANLGLTKKDLSKFYDDLITADIEVSFGGKEGIFKGVHKQAISEAQQKIASKSGMWPDYKRGEQILKAGATDPLPPGAKYDLLGKKVETGQDKAVPKGIKDVNQPGVDEAFDAAKSQQTGRQFFKDLGDEDLFAKTRSINKAVHAHWKKRAETGMNVGPPYAVDTEGDMLADALEKHYSEIEKRGKLRAYEKWSGEQFQKLEGKERYDALVNMGNEVRGIDFSKSRRSPGSKGRPERRSQERRDLDAKIQQDIVDMSDEDLIQELESVEDVARDLRRRKGADSIEYRTTKQDLEAIKREFTNRGLGS